MYSRYRPRRGVARRSPLISQLAAAGPRAHGGVSPPAPLCPGPGRRQQFAVRCGTATSPLGAGRCLPPHRRARLRGNSAERPAREGRGPGFGAGRRTRREGKRRRPVAPGTGCAPAVGAAPPGTAEEAPLPGRRSPGVAVNSRAGSVRGSPRRERGQRSSLPAGLRRWSRSRDVPGSRCCLWRRCRSSRGSPGTSSEVGPGEPRPRLPAPTAAAPSPSPRPFLPPDLFGSCFSPPNARRGKGGGKKGFGRREKGKKKVKKGGEKTKKR